MFPIPKSNSLIYVLKCPFTEKVMYVGLTTIGIKRIKCHWRDHRPNKSGNRAKSKEWIKNLRESGNKFLVEYIEYVDDTEQLKKREIFWIEYYRALGLAELNNLSMAGHLADKSYLTPEFRAKQSEKVKEAFKRPEVKENYRIGRANRVLPENYTPRSEETKKIHSNSEYVKSLKNNVVDEHGTIYESITQLAKELKVSKAFVSKRIKYSKPIKGKHYKMLSEQKNKLLDNDDRKISVIDGNGKIFESINEVSNYYSMDPTTVHSLIKEKRSSNRGISLKFYSGVVEYFSYPQKEKQKYTLSPEAKAKLNGNHLKKKLVDTNNRVYESINEASKINNIDRKKVTMMAKTGKIIKGIGFSYVG